MLIFAVSMLEVTPLFLEVMNHERALRVMLFAKARAARAWP